MRLKAITGLVLMMFFLVVVSPIGVSIGVGDFNSRFGDFVAQSGVDWWPMFRHDPNHTGYSTSTAPNTNNTLWNYTTGSYVMSPAVADGKVYVGSDDNNVYAFGPPPPYDVTIRAYCNTEYAWVSVNITMDGTPTGFNTTHTFTGLNGTHTFTVPSNDTNGHPFMAWSTGETNTTITITSAGTYTAYYQTPPPVGGLWIPVDKLALLAPYIALASTIILAVSISVAYIKYRKKQ